MPVHDGGPALPGVGRAWLTQALPALGSARLHAPDIVRRLVPGVGRLQPGVRVLALALVNLERFAS